MEHYKMFINGEFADAISGEVMESIDPGTGLAFATVPKAGLADAERAIMAARRAFDKGDWSGMDPKKRASIVYRFADEIAKATLALAVLECMDSGQVIRLTSLWGMMGQSLCRNLAYHAAHEFEWKEDLLYSGNIVSPSTDYIIREPIGVCVGISAWNFPFFQTLQKIAHAIIMGNTVVAKPASITSISATIIAEAAQAAGIPPGVVNVVTGPGAELGKILCTHPAVDKVSLTGSTEVGSTIMKLGADTIKKMTMELGGKSANIICDDINLDYAASGSVLGTFWHQGQVCESCTRLLVPAKIHDEFVEKLKKRADSLTIGYQLSQDTHFGPIASANQLRTVEEYVKIGKEEGATLYSGGKRAEVQGFEGGYYYTPTIFTDVKNSMRIAQEEIFGPVVSVIKYHDDEEAIAIANDSTYGLGGGIFTNNMTRAQHMAGKIRTGTMWINHYHSFGDMAPFGGYKQSGFGRENGAEGLKAYVQVKRVMMTSYADDDANFLLWRFTRDKTNISGMLPFNCKTNVISGKGCLPAILHEMAMMKVSRAVVLTDEGVRNAGLVRLVEDTLGSMCCGVFDQIESDPYLETVDRATAFALEKKADVIISVGGGSVMDTAKAVCVTYKNGGTCNDYIAQNRLTEAQTRHIAIPTTSGTGSEVTNVAVISSKESGRKVFLLDPFICPDVAILDPRFTVTLPLSMTVATAMDTMSHAIESMCGIMPHSFSDAHALHVIRLVKKWLPQVLENPDDLDARLQMQYASTLGGWAINMTQTTLGHAMAHTLGALHYVPHGTGCGIVLPKVMRYNVDHATEALAEIAVALGVNTARMLPRDAALAAADAVEEFLASISHPLKLSEIGLCEEDLFGAAIHAIQDTASIFNARQVKDPMEIYELYKQAF